MKNFTANDVTQPSVTRAHLEQFVAAADRMGHPDLGDLALLSFTLSKRATIILTDCSRKGAAKA
jgi:hypothetical protein